MLALACAICGVAAVAVAGIGKLVAVGLGLFAAFAGLAAYRRGGARPAARLAGAAGVAVGILAVAAGGAKVGLTLVALDRLGHFLQ
jgi:hypothetical protein